MIRIGSNTRGSSCILTADYIYDHAMQTAVLMAAGPPRANGRLPYRQLGVMHRVDEYESRSGSRAMDGMNYTPDDQAAARFSCASRARRLFALKSSRASPVARETSRLRASPFIPSFHRGSHLARSHTFTGPQVALNSLFTRRSG
jgi:hypothetical protein